MSKRRQTLFLIACIIVAVGVGYIAFYFVSHARQKEFYQVIQPSIESGGEEQSVSYQSPIDFSALWNINSDIYAWIEIPGTEISYPIVQSTTDEEDYYLNHTIEREEGFPGSIYTQKLNSKQFTDFNTVIYGHELADGTMFTALHNYFDEEFLNSNHTIKIYLPDKELTYEIFASVTYDDRLILAYFNNTIVADRQNFLQSLRDYEGLFREEVFPNENDSIITLSTCIWDMPENRFLVLAKKTGEVQ